MRHGIRKVTALLLDKPNPLETALQPLLLQGRRERSDLEAVRTIPRTGFPPRAASEPFRSKRLVGTDSRQALLHADKPLSASIIANAKATRHEWVSIPDTHVYLNEAGQGSVSPHPNRIDWLLRHDIPSKPHRLV